MSQPPARVVKVIGTGGTITNTSSGRQHTVEILKSIPQLSEIARLEIEDLALLGSSAMNGIQTILDYQAKIGLLPKPPPSPESFITREFLKN